MQKSRRAGGEGGGSCLSAFPTTEVIILALVYIQLGLAALLFWLSALAVRCVYVTSCNEAGRGMLPFERRRAWRVNAKWRQSSPSGNHVAWQCVCVCLSACEAILRPLLGFFLCRPTLA